MARIRQSFDRSLSRPRNLAHHVHTQLSCCLAAVQRALGGAVLGERGGVVAETWEFGLKGRGRGKNECLRESKETHSSQVRAVTALGELRGDASRTAAA